LHTNIFAHDGFPNRNNPANDNRKSQNDMAYFHKISVYTQNNKINGMVNNEDKLFLVCILNRDSEEEYMFSQPIITNAL
jgi:hypothetical protein